MPIAGYCLHGMIVFSNRTQHLYTMNALKILGLLTITTGLQAQSLVLKDKNGTNVTGDTIEVVYHPGPDSGWTELVAYVFPQNTGTTTLTLGAKKKEYDRQPDEYHAFCFGGTCFDSTTYVSPFHDIIAPVGTDSTFSGHYRFDNILHVPNEFLVAYIFYDVNNTTDSAVVYVKYNTMLQVGIEDHSASALFLSKAWPNPVTDILNFNYRLSGKAGCADACMIVTNGLGERLEKRALIQNEGTVSFETRNWMPGIYYCSVVVDNYAVATNKCIVIR